jgi:hypothetical protein
MSLRDALDAEADYKLKKSRKHAAQKAAAQAEMRAGTEPLVLEDAYLAVVRERDALRAAIARHQSAIEHAGRVLIVVGRNRARRKHQADHKLWAALMATLDHRP